MTPQTISWEFETLTECTVCQAARFSKIFSGDIRSIPLDFVRCTSCGLVFQNPRLTERALQQYFSSRTFIEDSSASDYDLERPLGYHDYSEWDASYKATASLRLKHIMRCKAPPARLLEIGTATGSFLDVARGFGYTVKGIDVSTLFAEMARRKYGLDIESHFIETAPLPAAAYDVVCAFGGVSCWRDPVRAMKNIRQSLAPGGVFVLNFPDFDAPLSRIYGRRYPEFNHASLTIFSRATMRRALEKAGVSIEFSETERQYASIGRIVTYLKSAVGRKIAGQLGLEKVTLPVIAVGTVFAICRPADQSLMNVN